MHDPTPAPHLTRWFCVALLGATILGGGLRLYGLSTWSIWADELYSIRGVGSPETIPYSKRLGLVSVTLGLWAARADLESMNSQAPWQWRSLGIEEFGARIGPCLVGILTIPILGLAGRRVLGMHAAALVALLLAVSPWHLYWSQASRFYTQQFLFYNLALLWYFEATVRRSPGGFVRAMAAMVLAYLSQPPAIFLCLVFAGDWLLCRFRRQPVFLGKVGWISGVVAVAFCMGLNTVDNHVFAELWEKFGSLQGHGWKTIILGTIYKNHPMVVVFALLAGVGLWRSRLGLYLLGGAILPVIPLIILSFKPDFYVHVRYAFLVHFSFLALVALGLERIFAAVQPRFGLLVGGGATAAMLVTLLLNAYVYLGEGHAHRRRWREAFDYVKEHRQDGEAVAMLSSEPHIVGHYYLESPEVISFPTSQWKLHELDGPTWMVYPAVSATRGLQYGWIGKVAELKAYFDLRLVQPFSSIRVYYYRPSEDRVLPKRPQVGR